MKKLAFSYLFLLLAIMGCEKTEIEPNPKPDSSLTAKVVAPASVNLNQTVTVDGSGSTDSQNKPFEFAWAFLRKPTGSTAAFSDDKNAKPTFVADKAGEYEVELTISNAAGKTSKAKAVVAAVGATETVLLSGEITADRILEDIFPDPTKVDYRVTGDVTVKALLTIKPGVVIEVDASKMIWTEGTGAIVAKGTAENKIIITGKEKIKGYWRGLGFASGNVVSELDFVEVSYAGNSPLPGFPSDQTANIGVGKNFNTAAQLKMTNTISSHSNSHGMVVQGPSLLVSFANNTFSNNTGTSLKVPVEQVGKLDAASHYSGGNGTNMVEITGDILEAEAETEWNAFDDGTPYFVKNNLEIRSGLRIKPGAVFEFDNNRQLYVSANGFLVAKGTADKKVTFTGRVKNKGYWRGIGIASNSPLNELDHVVVSYAGGGAMSSFPSTQTANVGLLGSSAIKGTLKMTNTTSSYSNGRGMVVQGGAVLSEFGNNVFSNNAGNSLVVPADQVGKLDAVSRFTGSNGGDVVEIMESELNGQNETVWPAFADGSKYLVSGYLKINSGLKLSPGSVIEMNPGKYIMVTVAGYLTAKGTAANKIVFTGKTKTKGSWNGIVFNSNSTFNELDYVEVAFGGGSALPGFSSQQAANIAVYHYGNAQLKLTNSQVNDSKGWGVVAEQGCQINADVATANTFANNTSGTVKK